jgi:hypothetical protein
VVHVPDASAQEDGLKEPPAFASFQVTVPVGVVGELEVSFTVAVSIT